MKLRLGFVLPAVFSLITLVACSDKGSGGGSEAPKAPDTTQPTASPVASPSPSPSPSPTTAQPTQPATTTTTVTGTSTSIIPIEANETEVRFVPPASLAPWIQLDAELSCDNLESVSKSFNEPEFMPWLDDVAADFTGCTTLELAVHLSYPDGNFYWFRADLPYAGLPQMDAAVGRNVITINLENYIKPQYQIY